MDGRGRWVGNVFIERLWRSLKYECVFLHAFETVSELHAGPPSGSATTMPDVPTPPWPGARLTRHMGQPEWRDWRPDENQNRAYPRRQTVRRMGTTSRQAG